MTAGVPRRSEARAVEEAIGRTELVAEIWSAHVSALPCISGNAELRRDAEDLERRLRTFCHLVGSVLREARKKRRSSEARRRRTEQAA